MLYYKSKKANPVVSIIHFLAVIRDLKNVSLKKMLWKQHNRSLGE